MPHAVTLMKIIAVSLVAIGICFFLYLFVGWPKTYPKTYGMTWSIPYAHYLGIDPIEGLRAALDDLGVRHVRLPAYWSEVESVDGVFDWHALDQQFELIHAKEGDVILVVGAKQPRWPECWYPEWSKTLTQEKREERQLAYVRAVVTRYKNHPALRSWQVENEPFFFSSFGECALFDRSIIPKEVSLVQELDRSASGAPNHPIVTTASGELSLWTLPVEGYTGLGVSTYRVVSNSVFDRWSYWFFPPWFYHRKATLFPVGSVKQVYVSEFQMEPWVTTDILSLSVEKQFKTFDLVQMQKNKRFAERMDMPSVYFWGVEWWYWMKEQHQHPEFWEEAKTWFR